MIQWIELCNNQSQIFRKPRVYLSHLVPGLGKGMRQLDLNVTVINLPPFPLRYVDAKLFQCSLLPTKATRFSLVMTPKLHHPF
jgi:hypothetical protein